MSPGRAIVGGLALALLGLALGGPLEAWAGRPSFVVHILQVVVLTLVASPLLLLAFGPLKPVARRLASPPIAGPLFIAHFVFWHLVPVHSWMIASAAVHAVALAGFFATGLLAWWGVCAPSTAAGRVRGPTAMLYLFVLGVPLQLLAGIITMSRELLYAGYGTGPRGFGLTAMADQQAGGLILWVPGGLVLWIAITVLWVRWARHGERTDREASGDDAAPPLTIPG